MTLDLSQIRELAESGAAVSPETVLRLVEAYTSLDMCYHLNVQNLKSYSLEREKLFMVLKWARIFKARNSFLGSDLPLLDAIEKCSDLKFDAET